jgi:hypothetical protein|tara:strand:- start:911 stop:1135 length:225 start_codon:yes stop_codon:yes gene_type:complete
MKLSNQAIGALMMALQKSLIEQSDIVPLLADMSFEKAPDVKRWGGKNAELMVANPPIVSLEGVTPPFTIEEIEE